MRRSSSSCASTCWRSRWLREEYELVERCGGAGDMGRDVIAMVKGGNGAWDNYQCKRT